MTDQETTKCYISFLDDKFRELGERIFGQNVMITYFDGDICIRDMSGSQWFLRTYGEKMQKFRAELLQMGFETERRQDVERRIAHFVLGNTQREDSPGTYTFVAFPTVAQRDIIESNGWRAELNERLRHRGLQEIKPDFFCLICGQTLDYPKGSVMLDLQARTPCGVCAECLKNHSMKEISITPSFKMFLEQHYRADVLLDTAVAKTKVDSEFSLDSYLSYAGLHDRYKERRAEKSIS